MCDLCEKWQELHWQAFEDRERQALAAATSPELAELVWPRKKANR